MVQGIFLNQRLLEALGDPFLNSTRDAAPEKSPSSEVRGSERLPTGALFYASMPLYLESLDIYLHLHVYISTAHTSSPI